MIKAAPFNRRIKIQKQETSRDPYGGIVTEWVDYATVWANVSYLSGKEYMKNGLDTASANVSVQLRAISITKPIDANYRFVLHNGELLNIAAVLPNLSNNGVINYACNQGLNNGA